MKEPNALIKILGSYVITQSTVFFNKVGGGVPTSDEIYEVKSTAWQEARMCTMGHSTLAALMCNGSTEKMCTACGQLIVVRTMMQ